MQSEGLPMTVFFSQLNEVHCSECPPIMIQSDPSSYWPPRGKRAWRMIIPILRKKK